MSREIRNRKKAVNVSRRVASLAGSSPAPLRRADRASLLRQTALAGAVGALMIFTPTASEKAQAQSTWNNVAGAQWGDAAQWTPAGVPNAVDAVVNFNATAGAPSGVDLSGGPFLVGTLNILNAVNGGFGFQLGTVAMSSATVAQIRVETNNTLSDDFYNGGLLRLDSDTVIDTVGASSAFRVATSISGAGALVKQGAGLVSLTAANAFAGGTTVRAGQLDIADGGGLGAGGLVYDGSGGLVRATTSMTVANSVSVAAASTGAAAAKTGETLTMASSNFDMQSGATLRFGAAGEAGTIIFNPTAVSYAAPFSQTIAVDAGVLRVGGAAAAADALRQAGQLSVASGATLDVNGFATVVPGLDGAGVVTNNGAAAAILTVAGPNDSNFAGVIVDGVSAIGLTKTGAQRFTLSGSNTYSGPTDVQQGVLAAGAAGVFSQSSLTTVAPGATLDLGGFAQNVATVQLNGGQVANGALTGAIQSAGGSITGVSGPATIDVNSGTTYFNAVTNSGATNVNGGLARAGGANGFSPNSAYALTAAGATLSVGGFSQTIKSIQGVAGSIVTNDAAAAATLTVGDATNTTFAGVMQDGLGTLALTKQGAGVLTLTGNNTYTGGTAINAGTLQIGAGGTSGSIVGDVAAAAGTTLVFDRSNALTFGGVVSGAGALVKRGPGRLTLTGNNTYAGGTTIEGGVLQIGAGGLTGWIVGDVTTSLNTRLAFNRSDAVNFGGVVSGDGGLSQNGTGLLEMSGVSAYSGLTRVNAGELRVTGALNATDVIVATGATLSGTGSIGGSVLVRGTLNPGANGPGALTIGGPLTLRNTATTNFEFGTVGAVGGATNDLVNVGGALTLGGALNVTAPSAGYYGLFHSNLNTADPYARANATGAFGSVTLAGAVAGMTPEVLRNRGQVNILVSAAGVPVQFWDGGADLLGDGAVNGGAGSWAADTTWTDAPGRAGINDAWRGNSGIGAVAVFLGQATGAASAPGVVTVVGQQDFHTLQFAEGGYTLTGGSLGLRGDPGVGGVINTMAGETIIGSSIVDSTQNSLRKVGAGTLTLTGVSTYTGSTDVAQGTLRVGAGGALTGRGDMTVRNGATARVDAGGLAEVGDLGVEAGAAFVNAGVTRAYTGTVTNAGVTTTTGELNAATAIVNLSGATMTASGRLSAPLVTNAGAFTVAGALSGVGTGPSLAPVALFDNLAGGTMQVNAALSGVTHLRNAGQLTIAPAGSTSVSALTNSGRIESAGAMTVSGVLLNSGLMNVSGAMSAGTLSNSGVVNALGAVSGASGATVNAASGTINVNTTGATVNLGAISNAGVINMVGGGLGNVVAGASYGGSGQLLVDASLATSASDQLRLSGGAAGASPISFNFSGSSQLHADTLVVSGAGATSFLATNAVATANPSPFAIAGAQMVKDDGLIQTWFGQASAGNWVLRSDVNTTQVSSVVASVTGMMATVSTVFSEPASAFISRPQDDSPNTFSIGMWGRTRDGQMRIRSSSEIPGLSGAGVINTVDRTIDTRAKASFVGFQIGVDAGLYNIENSGWSANVGLHGGYIDGSSKTSQASLDVKQPFGGVYGALSNGPFALDVLYRHDKFDMKLSPANRSIFPAGYGGKFKGDGDTVLVNAQYRFTIAENVFLEPSATLMYSRIKLNDVATIVGPIKWGTLESKTGRIGLTLRTVHQLGSFYVSPSIQASVWREFAGRTKARIDNPTLPLQVLTDRIGTYGQVSGGLTFIPVSIPTLTGFVRGDVRFGSKINGWAVNAGLRNQF